MGINLKDYGWEKDGVREDPNYWELPAGGYVCKIFDARCEPIENKGMRLICDIDIDEGEFKGFYLARSKSRGKWDFNAQFVRYVLREDNTITPAFRKFVQLLERENKNFQFDENDFEPDQLRALKCGFTFGYSEYIDKLGFKRERARVCFPETLKRIREGLFKIPPTKKLPPEKAASAKIPPAKPTPEKDSADKKFLGDAEKISSADPSPVPDGDFPF